MTVLLSTNEELERLLAKESPRLAQAILALGASLHAGREVDVAEKHLARLLAGLLGQADLLARHRTVLLAEKASRVPGAPTLARQALESGAVRLPPGGPLPPFRSPPPGSAPLGGAPVPPGRGIPRIAYDEAVEELLGRSAMLLPPGPAPVAERMAAVYEQGGFSLAKATTQETVERVQKAIADGLARGVPKMTTEALIEEMGPWSRGYANLVYRNATTSAYASGVFEQMKDPAAQLVIGAIRLDAVGDSSTCPICAACDGTIAPPAHPVWDLRCPPLHHHCQCAVHLVDRMTLRRQGLEVNGHVEAYIPNPDVKAAPGFGRRRDLPLFGPRL